MKRCEACGVHLGVQRHHKFSQTVWARRLYGDLLDDARNIMMTCPWCHASHLSTKLVHWDERAFCDAMGIEPRSKIAHQTREDAPGLKSKGDLTPFCVEGQNETT